jgi:hypothetical protein
MASSAADVMVIPVDVTAFCVGAGDLGSDGTSAFAGASTTYEKIATANLASYLGSSVTQSLDDPPQPMEPGVHLHWALPDALTRASIPTDAKGGKQKKPFAFPAVPNHWLVSRLVITGGTPAIRSWVVESDALAETVPHGVARVTVLVNSEEGKQNYRYLGKQSAVEDYEPPLNADRTFATMTGGELSAVATGMPTFASFYPNCRGALGFYDTMDDLPAGPVELMYVVTGWFDHPNNDPARPDFSPQALHKTHRWSVEAATSPTQTLYSGFIQKVTWEKNRNYVQGTSALDPIWAEIAVGNNPAEVMAAFLGAKVKPGVPLFESLLNALQFGLLEKSLPPQQSDSLANLRMLLHEKEFVATDAGSIYVIVKPVADGALGEDPLADAPNLPLNLADELNRLNVLQQQYDLAQTELAELRWQLFSDWYRIPTAGASTGDASGSAQQHIQDCSLLVQASDELRRQREGKLADVSKLIGDDFLLKSIPAERYWQPAEPSVLISAPELAFPTRYGGDAASGTNGLACRMGDQLATAITVNGQSFAAGRFAAVREGLAPTKLPNVDLCVALIEEACLLNSALLGVVAGQDAAVLQQATETLLRGEAQTLIQVTGKPPSPVGVHWWPGVNPWLPILLRWSTRVAPVQPTMENQTLVDYAPEFFTANFTIDPKQGGFIAYTPSGTPVDLKEADSNPEGWSILSPAPAQHFATQLVDFLARHPDDVDPGVPGELRQVADELNKAKPLVQSLNGFTQALLMRQQSLQLPVAVGPPPSKPSADYVDYKSLTDTVKPIVTGANTVSPLTSAPYNPIRAGALTLDPHGAGAIGLQAVDVFGQKRSIQFNRMVCAASMTAGIGGQTIQAAYLPPRLAQPARLLFRWIAADSDGLDEMNAHPASSPICGWLLPDHLSIGFFLYDQQGRPLLYLALNGDKTEVDWQSAPGDDRTIDQAIDQVLAHAHPQLLALGVALQKDPRFFEKFWQAVDRVHGAINPGNLSVNSSLAVLIGRPVALVQASLRLEVKGRPALDQSYAALASGGDTEHAFTGVQFPAVLGDLHQWDDGLIGYFKQKGSGFDLDSFYTEGATATTGKGVVQPAQDTLTLTVTPKLDASVPPDFAPDAARVLMLVDPRASVHAAMGILPTQVLQIPPDMAGDALASLGMSFLAAPVLKGNSGFAIPAPSEPGFTLSWIEQVGAASAPEWAVTPEIDPPSGGGVWAYTPQLLSEGWLRFNPAILEFSLLDASGRTLVTRGQAAPLRIQIVNRKPGHPIVFNPGKLAQEGDDPGGSMFYIHFGKLVAQEDVAKIALHCDGWMFSSLSSPRYGVYWAATPTAGNAVALATGASMAIVVEGLIPVADAGLAQANIYFDYYGVDSVGDGVCAALVGFAEAAG